MATSLKTLRIKRSLPPAHYSLKVESYSDLCSATKKYESGVFEAGGFNWKLILHPDGDRDQNGENHISLYLEMVDTDTLGGYWVVNAVATLFVLDQKEDKYLAVLDGTTGGVKRSHAMRTKWGFAQFLDLETFKDPSKGYLFEDSCVFGAEILVIKSTGNRETFSIIKPPSITNPTFTEVLDNFSELGYFHETEDFTLGGKKWTIGICPNGDKDFTDKSLALYVFPSKWESNTGPTYSVLKLRLRDQVNDKHHEKKVTHWFSSPFKEGRGFPNFISLEKLHKPSRGLIVKDTLVLQVEIICLSETKFG